MTQTSGNSEIIFLGTGTSGGVPRVSCLTAEPPTCRVCVSARFPGARNRRRNTSILVRYVHSDGRLRNIVIDVGKSFREAALDWLVRYRVPDLDAIVLTHAHADAIGGLDDLRDWTNKTGSPLPVYLRQEDLDIVAQTHSYIVDPARASSGPVPHLDFNVIDHSSFKVEGLKCVPLPVTHGSVTAFGYRIGDVVYISDASFISPETENLMREADLVVLDALRPQRPNGSHFALEQALDQLRSVMPRRALLTDMTHEYDHEPMNLELSRLRETDGLDVQLAYDGLRVSVDL